MQLIVLCLSTSLSVVFKIMNCVRYVLLQNKIHHSQECYPNNVYDRAIC